MVKCTKCGATLEDNAKFCSVCGAPVETPHAEEAEQAVLMKDSDQHGNGFDKDDIEKNKVMAVLAYIGLLFLVPLLAAKDSKYARFHTNQGIVLFISELILSAATGFFTLIPFVGSVVSGVCGILCLVLMIVGIVNAASGKAEALPIIGGFTILK